MERVDTVRGRYCGEGGHSHGEVLLRGWTQSRGGTAERVDTVTGGTVERVETVRGRYG